MEITDRTPPHHHQIPIAAPCGTASLSSTSRAHCPPGRLVSVSRTSNSSSSPRSIRIQHPSSPTSSVRRTHYKPYLRPSSAATTTPLNSLQSYHRTSPNTSSLSSGTTGKIALTPSSKPSAIQPTPASNASFSASFASVSRLYVAPSSVPLETALYTRKPGSSSRNLQQ